LRRRLDADPDGSGPTIRHATVRMPPELWVESWRRNPAQYELYADPYERLIAVNSSSPRGVIDLHFQTVDQVVDVLFAALNNAVPGFSWEFFEPEARSLWLVTGIGSHTVQKGRTLIYDVVHDYLEAVGIPFKVAKDNGNNAGGFLITL